MSSSVVILRTAGGWYHVTTLDDPIFSDILAPYLELDEIPKEVTLTSSVAKIIEENWPWWCAVQDCIKAEHFYPRMDPIPFTESVKQFTTLLNLTPEWRLFVTVDHKSMSYDLLIHHYTEIAGLMKKYNLEPTYDRTTSDVVFNILISLTMDSVSASTMLGISWVAGLTYKASMEVCALYLMDWDTFYQCIDEADIGDDNSDLILNTIRLIQGRGDLGRSNLITTDSSGPDAIRLYREIIKNYVDHEDHSLADYGLDFLVDVEDHSVIYNTSFIASIHSSIIHCEQHAHMQAYAYQRDTSIHMRQFYDIVDRLSHKLGRKGLEFIVGILRTRIRHCHNERDIRRVGVFLTFIEEELNSLKSVD